MTDKCIIVATGDYSIFPNDPYGHLKGNSINLDTETDLPVWINDLGLHTFQIFINGFSAFGVEAKGYLKAHRIISEKLTNITILFVENFKQVKNGASCKL